MMMTNPNTLYRSVMWCYATLISTRWAKNGDAGLLCQSHFKTNAVAIELSTSHIRFSVKYSDEFVILPSL